MKKGVWVLLGLFVIFITAFFFYSEIKGFARLVISSYGLVGVFIVTIVMDTVIQPVSPDILSFGAAFGGANIFVAALVGGIGSCIAGALGFYVGGWIGYDALQVSMKRKYIEKAELLFQKYGVWAVLVGAWSPIPYSSVCWSAGACKMKFKPFIIISILTRIPRFFLMALLGSLL